MKSRSTCFAVFSRPPLHQKDTPNGFCGGPTEQSSMRKILPKSMKISSRSILKQRIGRHLWHEMLRLVLFWHEKGVRIFRVDNPHTKPFEFWHWLIANVREKDPGVIFLSEAFTRPHVMKQLARAGFDQSYTYFTWRNTKWELTEYLNELVKSPLRDYLRPNFWPNTPDILSEYLQHGGRAAFIARFILAATLSSNYGIYGPVYELVRLQLRFRKRRVSGLGKISKCARWRRSQEKNFCEIHRPFQSD